MSIFVSAGSEKVASEYLGSAENPLNVDVYKVPNIYKGLTVYMSMTSTGCIPVTEELHGNIGDSKYQIIYMN